MSVSHGLSFQICSMWNCWMAIENLRNNHNGLINIVFFSRRNFRTGKHKGFNGPLILVDYNILSRPFCLPKLFAASMMGRY